MLNKSPDVKRASGGAGAPRKVGRSLPMALLRAREAVMARFRPMLLAHGINEQQWRVIRMLGEYGELDASELSRRACILGPSLTRMIRALEERKLLQRRKDRSDGRRILLAITPRAAALISDVTPGSAAIYREIEARIGGERLEAMLDQLDALARGLEE